MARLPPVDPARPPSAFKRLLVGFALTKAGTWLYKNAASRLDPWLVRLTRGRVDSALGVVPIMLLTARGARSGVERTVPLVYFTDGDDVIVMASSFGRPRHPAWYHNARASGSVRLYRRGVVGEYAVRETVGEERDRLYGLATQLYRGYGIYAHRAGREIPVLRLSPAA